MNLDEAIKDGIRFVRKPHWNPTAKLELPETDQYGVRPWCQLHDAGKVIPLLYWYCGPDETDWEAVPAAEQPTRQPEERT